MKKAIGVLRQNELMVTLCVQVALVTGLFFALVAKETGGKRARARAAALESAPKPATEIAHGDD